jgi:predicted amidohydrolase
MGANIDTVVRLVRRTASDGAEMIFLPENAAFMDRTPGAVRQNAFPEDTHPALAAFRELARESGAWVHTGSMAIVPQQGEAILPANRDPNDGRLVNRSHLLDPTGDIRARYDKIHLFDVTLSSGESYAESATFAAGDKAATVWTPFGELGLSICYDLRFPDLYRVLAQDGVDFIAIPSAFTRTTGSAHWHSLIRARAIENGCFVFAAAQCGDHPDGRQTFGHAMIVSPWGEVLQDAGQEEGIITALVDLSDVRTARDRLPSLRHGRPFGLERT